MYITSGSICIPRRAEFRHAVHIIIYHTTSYYIILYITSYYITLHPTISYYILLYHTIYYILLFHITSYYIILHHTIYYILLYHTTSYYIILYHTTSYYVILHPTISYYIILHSIHVLPVVAYVFPAEDNSAMPYYIIHTTCIYCITSYYIMLLLLYITGSSICISCAAEFRHAVDPEVAVHELHYRAIAIHTFAQRLAYIQ